MSAKQCLYKQFCLLGYNVMWSIENQPTLQRNETEE
jgi:hypothetical protein